MIEEGVVDRWFDELDGDLWVNMDVSEDVSSIFMDLLARWTDCLICVDIVECY